MHPVDRLVSRSHPYLWVVGEGVTTLPLGDRVAQRYRVIGHRTWLDTCPDQERDCPDYLPPSAQPYLVTHGHRLHLPGLYAVLDRPPLTPLLLLDNVPIHPQTGDLLPSLETALLEEASPQRQLYWLWQIWELWQSLASDQLQTSLLVLDNLRVEGWRLRLLELYPDLEAPSLADLAATWRSLLPTLPLTTSTALTALIDAMGEDPRDGETVAKQLNQLLLSQAAATSRRFTLAGGTTPGPNQPRNEDGCWPTADLVSSGADLQIGIVCDGVGGHDGGEVASQLAIQSLKLQLQALLTESQQESHLLPPQVVMEQLRAVITIVNDLINFQNDNQARVGRQRMGTTLVLALILPQRIQTDQGWKRVQEVYLAHVGDSRAYWITPDYCHLLTVDDDIAGREVRAGRQLYAQAQARSDAGALTQALGTRHSDHLTIHLQRFIPDEPGILLLCSDGLSDNHRIEEAWANYIGLIVKEIISLDSAVASWLELANQKNGHDNSAVVLIHHQLLAPTLPVTTPEEAIPTSFKGVGMNRVNPGRVSLYGESQEPETEAALPANLAPTRPLWLWLLGLAAAFGLAVTTGWWWLTRPPVPPTEPSRQESTVEPEGATEQP
ncbi:MAG: protein phosphatase 2C domain-containing protein [Cyanobacteriota bacterium]|nr:protein phosphatase 2C domain-containing protein [Cyanobacteriota bacterium]